MNFKTIPLTRGFVTIVDEADYEWLNQWKWRCQKGKNNNYAVRQYRAGNCWENKRIYVSMHRLIKDAPKGMEVDHRDGNGLNNRRENLRICTRLENSKNNKGHKRRTSKYKGVSIWRNKFKSRIRVNYELIYLGLFKTEAEAALAYNEAAKKYHGEFANLNEIK